MSLYFSCNAETFKMRTDIFTRVFLLEHSFSVCLYFACRVDSAVVFYVQLDQLVIDSAVEKRELEHKHALIQQRVRQQHNSCF